MEEMETVAVAETEDGITDESVVKIVPRRRPKFRGTIVETVKLMRTYRCRVCSASVASIHELLSHLDTEHGIKTTEQPRIVLASERDEKKDQEDVSNLLESIARANKDTSLPSSSASDTSNDYHANSSKNDDSIYKKWSYVTKQELEVYGANLRCSYCFFDFNTRHRYRFLDHEESHRQGKFIVCKYCGMCFSYKYSLQSHLRGLEKSPDDHYQCQQCDSSFANRKCLLYHLTRHHDGRHRCQICEQVFTLTTQLGRHTKSEHSEQIQGKFFCPECKRNDFSSTKVLRRHIFKVHFRVVCPFCQAAFHAEANCNQHIRWMHGNHPPGSRPFECAVCPQTFTGKAYLTRHYRKNHKMEPPVSSPKVPQQEEVSEVSRVNPPQQEEVADFSKVNPPQKEEVAQVSRMNSELRRSSTRAGRSSKVNQNYNEDSVSDPEFMAQAFVVKKINTQPESEEEMEIEEEEESHESDEEESHENDEADKDEEKEIQSDTLKTCNICLKEFSNYWNRIRHQKSMHKRRIPTIKKTIIKKKINRRRRGCKRRVFRRRRAKSPLPSSENSNFSDDYKNQPQQTAKAKAKPKSQLGNYSCPNCKYQTPRNWLLSRHMKSCKSKIILPIVKAEPNTSKNTSVPKVEKTVQEESPKSDNINLQEVVKQRNQRTRKTVNNAARSRRSQLQRKSKTNNITKPPIVLPGSVIVRPDFTGLLQIATCPFCEKKLTSNQGLQYHIRQFHPNKKAANIPTYSFICPYCTDERVYTSKQSLMRHANNHHPKEVQMAEEKRKATLSMAKKKIIRRPTCSKVCSSLKSEIVETDKKTEGVQISNETDELTREIQSKSNGDDLESHTKEQDKDFSAKICLPIPVSIKEEVYSNPPSVEAMDFEKDPFAELDQTEIPLASPPELYDEYAIGSNPENAIQHETDSDSYVVEEIEIYPCCACNEIFTNKRDRMLHTTRAHTNRIISEEQF